MDRPQYEPLAEIEVDAARPEPQGFTLTGQGPDHAEYQLDLRFECRSTHGPVRCWASSYPTPTSPSRGALPGGSSRRCVNVVTALRNDSSVRNRSKILDGLVGPM